MVCESEAYYEYPDFTKKVMGIIDPKRSSDMQPQSAQKFRNYLHTVTLMNEATFLHVIFPLLMKDGYELVEERADFTAEEKKILKEAKSI